MPGMTFNSLGYKSDGKIYSLKKVLPNMWLPLIGTGDIIGKYKNI